MVSGQQLLGLVGSQVSSTVNTLPIGYDIQVGPKSIFGKLLNNLMGGVVNGTNANYGGGLGAGMMGFNSFNNASSNPLNFLSSNLSASTTNPTSIAQAPGQALIVPPTPQNISQAMIQAQSPLQGIAQGGGISQVGFGNQLPNGPIGLPYAGLPTPDSKFNVLLYPILGLISMVKSLFGIRKIMHSEEPINIDKENLAYNRTKEFFNDVDEHEEGSFDEIFYPMEENANNSLELQRLNDI